MSKILLDYAFPITVTEATPAANTGFLKQIILVCMPKAGQEANVGTMYLCTSSADVAVRTDNVEATQIFAAGHSRVYILLADDLDIADFLEDYENTAYTLLISGDFDETYIDGTASTVAVQEMDYFSVVPGATPSIVYSDTATSAEAVVTVLGSAITVGIESGVTTAATVLAAIEASTSASALVTATIDGGQTATTQESFVTPLTLAGGFPTFDYGTFDGVIGFSTDDTTAADAFAALDKHVAFFTNSTNKGKNMAYAFGKMLSNVSSWKNQQYIAMPLNDGVTTLGQATSLFDEKISFVITDEDFGNRLALFAAGGKAIVAPYIVKNYRLSLQSRALSWISANQPAYTERNAARLEAELIKEVLEKQYINTGLVESGTIEISLVNDNFVATGNLTLSEPKALWRVANEMIVS